MNEGISRQVREHVQYHSSNRCVVCDNEDFTRCELNDKAKPKILQEHRLNHIHLDSGKVIVFCNSCLQDVRSKIRK